MSDELASAFGLIKMYFPEEPVGDGAMVMGCTAVVGADLDRRSEDALGLGDDSPGSSCAGRAMSRCSTRLRVANEDCGGERVDGRLSAAVLSVSTSV